MPAPPARTKEKSPRIQQRQSKIALTANTVTTDSTWMVITRLATPLVLNMLLLAASNFAEGWIAGRLGVSAQAALGIGSQIWFFLMMLTLALAAGTTAIVSRFYGAGDLASATEAARQSLLLAIIFGALSTVIGLSLGPLLLEQTGAATAVRTAGCIYLRWTTIAMVPYTFLWITNSIFRAKGDAATPMLIMLGVTAITTGLDLFLCLGAPRLGLAGIGLSWLIASVIGSAINWKLLATTELGQCVVLSQLVDGGMSIDWLKRFLRIGLPACLQDLAVLGGSFGIFSVLAHMPGSTTAQAAWAAGWRVEESLVIMPMYGLNIAAAAIVGQNLGARSPSRAKAAGWQIGTIGCLICLTIGGFICANASQIAAIMSVDNTVNVACTEYLRVVCWTEPFFALWLVLSGAMQGAGYTKAPMTITIACFDGARILLAYASISTASAPTNIWLSIALSTIAAGVLSACLWHHGAWQKQTI